MNRAHRLRSASVRKGSLGETRGISMPPASRRARPAGGCPQEGTKTTPRPWRRPHPGRPRSAVARLMRKRVGARVGTRARVGQEMSVATTLLPRMHPALCQYPLGRTRTPGRARRLTHMAEPATIEPQRKLRPNAFVVDALFAGALLLMIGLPSVAGATALGAGAVSAVVGSITSLGMPAALAWRRTRPVHSAVAVYAMALAHVLAGLLLTGSDLLIFVSLYSVTVYGPVWARRTALGSGFLGCL